MEQRNEPQREDLDRLRQRNAEDAAAVRLARLQRDGALAPAERLDKLAALCRQAALLRTAHRTP